MGVLCPASALASEELDVWVIDGHAEKPYFVQLADSFNKQYEPTGIRVKLKPIPGYNDAVEVAWLSGDLPDVLMIDGPNMAHYVWHGMLRPIDELVDDETLATLLPGIIAQGTYPPDERIYMLSAGESSVALWANRDYLEQAGIEIPRSIAQAWDYDEFCSVLDKLSQIEAVRWPLDFKINYDGEWRSYGYYPLLRSAGGQLIDADSWRAGGVLDSRTTGRAVDKIYNWIRQGWVVPASAGDNRFFGDRSAALSWAGNWVYRSYSEALGDDLVVVPAPRLGARAFATNGSWGWAVPADSQRSEAIAVFLNFVLSKEQVVAWSRITGYIPARTDVVHSAPVFAPGGLMHIFAEQARETFLVRPVHPAYPVISAQFGQALADIFSGADIDRALARAAREIDWDAEDNLGYPPFGQ